MQSVGLFHADCKAKILVGAIFASLNFVEDGGMDGALTAEFKQGTPFHANAMFGCKVIKTIILTAHT